MKKVAKKGADVLELLRTKARVDPMGKGRPYVKIDNSEAFMPVSVEMLDANGAVEWWAVGHWYTQNGDCMRDPEVEFIRIPGEEINTHEWLPVGFKMDPRINQEFVHLDHYLMPVKFIDMVRQADCATFCTTWMRNVKQQQRLRA